MSFSRTQDQVTVLLMTCLLGSQLACASGSNRASGDTTAGTTLDRSGASYSSESSDIVSSYMDDQATELDKIRSAKTERVGKEIRITWDSEVLFDLDSAMLNRDVESDLKLMARVLTEYPETRLLVTGHTDNSGSEQNNFKLSERRARSVKNFLVEEGVTESRVSTLGYGELRPVASNDTPEGRRMNRRIVIQIKPGEALKARAQEARG